MLQSRLQGDWVTDWAGCTGAKGIFGGIGAGDMPKKQKKKKQKKRKLSNKNDLKSDSKSDSQIESESIKAKLFMAQSSTDWTEPANKTRKAGETRELPRRIPW